MHLIFAFSKSALWIPRVLAYLEHISTSCILLAYDPLEGPVAPLSGASRPARGLDNDPRGLG